MGAWRGLSIGVNLDCVKRVSERAWALVGVDQLEDGNCLIADVTDPGDVQIRGMYHAASGDVFDCSNDKLASFEDAELVLSGTFEEFLKQSPAIHILGSPDGATGQLTARQPAGNYLRACRWDRIKPGSVGRPDAILRTLPQCGCGGSLGAPQLFDSFVEMSTYHFCAFCIDSIICRI